MKYTSAEMEEKYNDFDEDHYNDTVLKETDSLRKHRKKLLKKLKKKMKNRLSWNKWQKTKGMALIYYKNY